MPDVADQPAKPARTWRPMVGWALGALTVLQPLLMASATERRAPAPLTVPPPSYWEAARGASLVVVGKVIRVAPGGAISMTVLRVVKGPEGLSTLSFMSPFRALPTGTECLVFLIRNPQGGMEATATTAGEADQAALEREVRDIIALSQTESAKERCALLVRMAMAKGRHWSEVQTELLRANRSDCLEALAPLRGQDEGLLSLYLQLLGWNPSPEAASILRSFVSTGTGPARSIALRMLGQRDVGDEARSLEIAQFLKDRDPVMRSTAISALGCRKYLKAASEVERLLDDSDSRVRQAALAWPWDACPDSLPGVLPKLRLAAASADPMERNSACHTLLSIRDLRSFYRLCWRSITDGRYGMGVPGTLSPFLKDRPFSVALLLLWPSILAAALSLLCGRWTGRRRAAIHVATGAVAGYAVGAVAGWLIGKYHGGDPLLNALVLAPFASVPLVIGFSITIALARARRAAAEPSAGQTR